MSKIRSFLPALVCMVAFSISCKKEAEAETDPYLEAAIKRISRNRWMYQYTYSDTCESAHEPIKGQAFLNFTSDFKVKQELDLTGETYNCSNESFIIGSWKYRNVEYLYYPQGTNDSIQIVITEDNGYLCYVTQGEQTCLVPEN